MTFRSKEAAQALIAMNPGAYMVIKVIKIDGDTVEVEPVVMLDEQEITYGERFKVYVGDTVRVHGATINLHVSV